MDEQSSRTTPAMPVIPGYRYDSQRKRYFKLQPGQREHSQNQEARAPRPVKRRKGKRQPEPEHRTGLYRYLRDVETNVEQPSLPVANSLLLSACKRTRFYNIDYEEPNIKISFSQLRKLDNHYRQIARTDEGESLWDMDQVNTFFEVRRNANLVIIGTHLYPLGASRCTIHASEADICVSEGSWLAHGGDVGRFYQVCRYRIMKIQPREEQRLLLVLRRPFLGTMAISNKGVPALAIHRKVYVLDTEAAQRTPRSPRYAFNVSAGGMSSIDNLKFFGPRIAGSLFNGALFVYDVAHPTTSVWESRDGKRVVDMRSCDDGKTLFVSSMLNHETNLVCWDTRIPYARTPPIRFEGHRNSHKNLHFHVDTNYACGLLAAGGDDGVVRLWDARKAGVPITTISVKGELPEAVKLVGFRGGVLYNPSLWVQTDKSLYLYQRSQLLL